MLFENKEKTDNNENTKILLEFYKTVFQQREAEPKLSLQQMLKILNLPRLKDNEIKLCDGSIFEILKAIHNMNHQAMMIKLNILLKQMIIKLTKKMIKLKN